jgi:hypothetical protein
MNEMIERVARAICRESGEDPDEMVSRVEGPGYIFPAQAQWLTRFPFARAAIAAMREPTAAMKAATSPDRVRSEGSQEHFAGLLYRAMIDAALDDPERAP